MKPVDQLELSPVHRLRDYWRGKGAPSLSQPIHPDDLHAWESANGLVLPADFRQYLELANGFDQRKDYQDQRGFNFWPLEKLSRWPDHDAGRSAFAGVSDWVIFCDYLDRSWAYALSTSGHQVVLVETRDGRPKVVARSFSQFIERYLDDDARIYA